MKKLFEGMRAGDLSELVLPLISVDEYESKIDGSAVVIGFYVHDKEAANDLNRFLQKSPVAILSSEVSPAPDQHGYYLVFIEFMFNDILSKNIKTILEEVSPLCEIDSWKMRVRKSKGLIKFDEEAFTSALEKARESDKPSIVEFFKTSTLENLILEGDILTLINNRLITKYCVVDFDVLQRVIERNGLDTKATNLQLYEVARTNRFSAMLGEGWSVNEIGSYLLLEHYSSEYCLLLKFI